jgi:hypothetical protein
MPLPISTLNAMSLNLSICTVYYQCDPLSVFRQLVTYIHGNIGCVTLEITLILRDSAGLN